MLSEKNSSFSSSKSASLGCWAAMCLWVGAVGSPWQPGPAESGAHAAAGGGGGGGGFCKGAIDARLHSSARRSTHAPALMTMTRAQWIRRWGRTHAATRQRRQHPSSLPISIIHAPNCGWCWPPPAAAAAAAGLFLVSGATMTVCTRRHESVKGNTKLLFDVCHAAKFLGETSHS